MQGNIGTRFIAIWPRRSEEHTSELQSRLHLVCRLLLEKNKYTVYFPTTDVNGHFNALNISGTKRFSNGFQFFVKYQLSRSMDRRSWERSGGNRDTFNLI